VEPVEVELVEPAAAGAAEPAKEQAGRVEALAQADPAEETEAAAGSAAEEVGAAALAAVERAAVPEVPEEADRPASRENG
jgi:hypothetical protein